MANFYNWCIKGPGTIKMTVEQKKIIWAYLEQKMAELDAQDFAAFVNGDGHSNEPKKISLDEGLAYVEQWLWSTSIEQLRILAERLREVNQINTANALEQFADKREQTG
jgi:hypothetical protein